MGQDKDKWVQSRRNFFKNSGALIVGASLPWFVSACTRDELMSGLSVFKESQYKLLKKVHEVLFPRDEFGPGASDLKSVEYLDWALSDKRIDQSDKEYMLKGIKWMEESAEEELSKSFDKLNEKELEELIARISKTSWGDSWLSRNLSYIIEANFSDELYGFNLGGIGWKWLDHYPGYPRPTKALIYDRIFDTLSNFIYNKI